MPKISQKSTVNFGQEDEMLPHSEAKVALYGRYLEKYLAILGVVDFITKINIFDIFCGTGVYKNGKLGSPIVAFEKIRKTREFLKTLNKNPKEISLMVNDGNSDSIDKVSDYFVSLSNDERVCEIDCNNLDASHMFKKVLNIISTQPSSERNLVFIDPTGYKEIHKESLAKLLKFNSEIVLFLPVSFMYRFKGVVQKDYDNPSYEHLRRFIKEFFSEDHPIRLKHDMDIFAFILHLKQAFSFENQYYSSSFYLQRSRANYYALFFVTSSSLGLERINDAKWDIDRERGEGFVYEELYGQMQLFQNEKLGIAKSKTNELEAIISAYINGQSSPNNIEIYSLVINNGFRVTHAKNILLKWQDEGRLTVWDVTKNQLARKKSFYITSDSYKAKEVKATFKLK